MRFYERYMSNIGARYKGRPEMWCTDMLVGLNFSAALCFAVAIFLALTNRPLYGVVLSLLAGVHVFVWRRYIFIVYAFKKAELRPKPDFEIVFEIQVTNGRNGVLTPRPPDKT